VQHKVVGTLMPVLEVSLDAGESVFAESGELSWISASIQLHTSTSAGGQQGGFMNVLGRALAGATIFMTEYTAQGGPGLAAFCAKLPGQIMPVELTGREAYWVHRHGFVAATPGVQLNVAFQQRLGAGIFGGTGFRMQRISGQGLAWVELHGEVVVYDLQPGNTLRIHPGHVAMFQEGMQFNITTVPGIRNALFGNAGLFLATITGPGRVWLQSMTLPHLAHAIAEYLPHPSGEGSLLGGLLQGS
jgi:uncharacterized protein (TIGR00266 family)